MSKLNRLLTTLLMASVLLLAVACSMADPEPTSEEPAVSDPLPVNEGPEPPAEEPVEEEPSPLPPSGDLAPLPRLAGDGGGFGGGLAAESSLGSADAATSMMVPAYDPFSGTQFILNTTLPVEPVEGMVWRQPERNTTAELAFDMAARFGFSPPLYQEALPGNFAQAVSSSGEPVEPAYIPTMPYYAFNGPEQLIVTANSVFYTNNAVETDFDSDVPFDVARAAAESFLQERGLLNFEYMVQEWHSGQLTFNRVINGEPLNQPEIYVTVNNNGEINYLTYEILSGLNELGNYPLITAEQAWQKLQSGIMENNIPYEFMNSNLVGGDAVVVYEDPYADEYQFWNRQYEAGDAIQLYAYPLVYLPIEADVPPRILVNNFILSAATEELQAIADAIGQQFLFNGTIGPDNKLELSSWETVEYSDPLYLEGMVDRLDDGTVLLYTIEGETYVIPDAPADLPDDLEVFVFAWSALETDAEYPVLAWENIEKRINYEVSRPVEEPLPIEGPIGQFSSYESVTINEVTLGYYWTYQYAFSEEGFPASDAPPIVIQPVWRFTGTIAGGPPELETVTFYVQAVDSAYLNEAPQG